MEGYVSENEQLESFKQWWKKYGKLVTAGLVFGVAVLAGGQWWRHNQTVQAEAASAEYQQLVAGLTKNNAQVVQDRASRIISQYSSTPYAAFAALALAKTKLEQGDSKSARTQLQWVLDHSDQPGVQNIARLRLARILFSEGQNAPALAMLTAVESGDFATQYEELKGDIQVALGKPAEARAAYTKALAGLEPGAAERVQLQMKLDDLGAK